MIRMYATVSPCVARSGARTISPMRGFLTALPRAGAPLVLYAPRPSGSAPILITSIVERVLGDEVLFVETRRSLYRVAFDECVEAAIPSRLASPFDGFDLTFTPAVPSFAGDDDREIGD